MKYLLAIILGAIVLSCNAQENLKAPNSKVFKYEFQMDTLAERFLSDSLIHSLSFGVYYKGEVFTKHYGELDPGKDNLPTNNSVYDIASVTKTFVGTLIKQAELEGKLTIEDDVRKYLQGSFPNLEYKGTPITIRHLLSHSSRLPRYLPETIINEFDVIDETLADRISKIERSYTKSQFMKDLAAVKIDTFPGFKYAYSNAGVELACLIMENIYNKPFDELLEEKILSKANMSHTSVHLNDAQKDQYVSGYGIGNRQMPSMVSPLWGGSGNGKSTTADLMNYIQFQLKGDELASGVREVTFDKDLIDGDDRIKMGYLWQVSTDRDFGQVIKHHGGAMNAQNYMLIYPESDLGISVMTNQSSWTVTGPLLGVAYGLLDAIALDK